MRAVDVVREERALGAAESPDESALVFEDGTDPTITSEQVERGARDAPRRLRHSCSSASSASRTTRRGSGARFFSV
jgi:hypothetical protein